jgi:uncharacterized protein YyaL (SSP411 family)
MLYDQGLLLTALAVAAPLASSDAVREEYAWAVRATAGFMRRDLGLPGGGFAGALSAESAGVEGATYTWTDTEMAAALAPADLELARVALGAPPAGSTTAVTLHRPSGRGSDADAVDAVLERLSVVRAARPRPDLDGKLLTSWNAIAARGLIDSGSAFGDAEMVADGLGVVDLLLETAVGPDGVERERSDPSVASVRLLEDAAHVVSALLTAHDATGKTTYLEQASALHTDTLERFAEGNVLFLTPADTDLPVRPRESGDSAVPSGASTTIENAVRLGAAESDASHFAFARAALAQVWAIADFAPEQAGRALAAGVALELAARG